MLALEHPFSKPQGSEDTAALAYHGLANMIAGESLQFDDHRVDALQGQEHGTGRPSWAATNNHDIMLVMPLRFRGTHRLLWQLPSIWLVHRLSLGRADGSGGIGMDFIIQAIYLA
jgi:hypothetical protein